MPAGEVHGGEAPPEDTIIDDSQSLAYEIFAGLEVDGPLASSRALQSDPDENVRTAAERIASGQFHDALQLLRGMITSDPDHHVAWQMYIDVLAATNDQKALRKCALELAGMSNAKNDLRATAWGRLAAEQDNLHVARTYLESAYEASPDSAFVVESLTRLDIRQERVEDARIHVSSLLNLDPDNAFGHQVAACFRTSNGGSEASAPRRNESATG